MANDVSHTRPESALRRKLPFESVVLLLQGGGALGAYQAGVYEALAEAGIEPDWVAGISIGAINAAIIAGNPPERRLDKLRSFWNGISSPPWGVVNDAITRIAHGNDARLAANQLSAATTLFAGVPGFFKPRVPGPWHQPRGSIEATSYYDTSELRGTLERLVDFDRINAAAMRFSVGAVNVRSGNFLYFDNRKQAIGPEHVMASGSLPPGFPPTEIEGERYWDGGLVSNTPLYYVLEFGPRRDTLAFQVDLWSAHGDFPESMAEVMTRQKEIVYSSRTRENTERFDIMQRIRCALSELLPTIPDEKRHGAPFELLSQYADDKVYSVVELIYRAHHYEGDSKDYEFSRVTMEEHWRSGYADTARTLRHPQSLARPKNHEGLALFDVHDFD